MQNPCTRSLILAIGGPQRPGEGVAGYLWRVSKKAKLGVRSTERAWYRQYASENTLSKLKQAADNAQELASRLEQLATTAEMEGRSRSDVDAIRALAGRFRRLDCGTGKPDGGD